MKCGYFCGAILFVTGVLLFSLSWATIEPTEYGLVHNSLTGYVTTDQTWTSGRYLIGPTKEFIKFPATQVMLEFSDRSETPPVEARTGSDINDPDSGGQPVRLSLSILYQLKPDDLGRIYTDFSTQYESRYVQFVRQAVSDVSQRFSPQTFWQDRGELTREMLKAIHDLVSKEGGADVLSLQLISADFSRKFEDSLVSIQLATQARTTQEYQKQVVKAKKDIDILRSQIQSEITVVSANAAAARTLVLNNASAAGFHLTQNSKAANYRLMQEELGLTNEQLMDYLRVKSVRTHNSQKLVVGLPGIK